MTLKGQRSICPSTVDGVDDISALAAWVVVVTVIRFTTHQHYIHSRIVHTCSSKIATEYRNQSGNFSSLNYTTPIPTGSRDSDFDNPESRDWKFKSGIAIPSGNALRLGVKAGLIRVWVALAAKTVWSPCHTRAVSERALEIRSLYIKRYINSAVYFYCLLSHKSFPIYLPPTGLTLLILAVFFLGDFGFNSGPLLYKKLDLTWLVMCARFN